MISYLIVLFHFALGARRCCPFVSVYSVRFFIRVVVAIFFSLLLLLVVIGSCSSICGYCRHNYSIFIQGMEGKVAHSISLTPYVILVFCLFSSIVIRLFLNYYYSFSALISYFDTFGRHIAHKKKKMWLTRVNTYVHVDIPRKREFEFIYFFFIISSSITSSSAIELVYLMRLQ